MILYQEAKSIIGNILLKIGKRGKRLLLTYTKVLQKSEWRPDRNLTDLNNLDHILKTVFTKSILLVLMVKLNKKINSTWKGDRMTPWRVSWLAFAAREKNIPHLPSFSLQDLKCLSIQDALRNAGPRTKHNWSSAGQNNRPAAPLLSAEITDYCLCSSGSTRIQSILVRTVSCYRLKDQFLM